MTHKPRMPRADLSAPSQTACKARLEDAVKAEAHVTWHRPEHRSDSIEPDQELFESYMDNLRFGSEG